MKNIILSSTFLVCLLLSSVVTADSMRCGHRLVKDGDSQVKVRDICGSPHGTGRSSQQIMQDGRLRRVSTTFWVYRGGKGKLDKKLHFYQRKMIAVETGRRR